MGKIENLVEDALNDLLNDLSDTDYKEVLEEIISRAESMLAAYKEEHDADE